MYIGGSASPFRTCKGIAVNKMPSTCYALPAAPKKFVCNKENRMI